MTRSRLSVSHRHEDETPADGTAHGGDRSGRSGLRTALLALGAAALAYVALRRARDRSDASAEGTAGRSADVGAGFGRDIPVEEAGAGRREESGDERAGTGEAAGEGPSPDETNLGRERSDEEVEARGEPDVQTEPAEPGEMTVDEDVVEDVVDRESDEEETAAPDEEAESEDENEDRREDA